MGQVCNGVLCQTEKVNIWGRGSSQTSLSLSGWCLDRVPVTSKGCRCKAAGSVLDHLELHVSTVPMALAGVTTPVSDNSAVFATLMWEMDGLPSRPGAPQIPGRELNLKLLYSSPPRSSQGPLSASPLDLRHCCPCSARLSNQTQTEDAVGGGYLLKSSEVPATS